VKVDNDDSLLAIAKIVPPENQGTGVSSILSLEKVDEPKIDLQDLSPDKTDPAKLFIRANPSARHLAREIGVDLSEVRGSGMRGRITREDVKGHARKLIQSLEKASGNSQSARRSLPDFSEFGAIRREPLTNIAAATSNNMEHAWSRIPHAWLQQSIDITELEAWRQKNKHEVKNRGGALTITVVLAKAVSIALKDFPKINSSYDEDSNEIIYKEYTDIGIAVDTEQGLLVPTLRQVDRKGMMELSKELKLLSEKACTRKLSAKELQGAGITISNLGSIGLSSIFPIVNWPQVAIIGVAASAIEPRFYEEEFIPRRTLTVTLGFDHRVINGADGAKFLVHLKELLEDTRLMLF
jgi:pyruvate dehydrogenase E2 component (dihydrolipoamide acetyltransferase)